MQGRTHNLKAAVLSCDRGYNASSIPQIQAAGLSTQPLSSTLLAQSIYNSNSSASRAFDWRAVTCTQGSAFRPNAVGSSSSPGCTVAEEAACFADLVQHIKQDDDYWLALYVPGNFSVNFAAAFNNASNSGAAYMQMSMDYLYPQAIFSAVLERTSLCAQLLCHNSIFGQQYDWLCTWQTTLICLG